MSAAEVWILRPFQQCPFGKVFLMEYSPIFPNIPKYSWIFPNIPWYWNWKGDYDRSRFLLKHLAAWQWAWLTEREGREGGEQSWKMLPHKIWFCLIVRNVENLHFYPPFKNLALPEYLVKYIFKASKYFLSLMSIVVHCNPLLSIIVHCYPLLSIVVIHCRYHRLPPDGAVIGIFWLLLRMFWLNHSCVLKQFFGKIFYPNTSQRKLTNWGPGNLYIVMLYIPA